MSGLEIIIWLIIGGLGITLFIACLAHLFVLMLTWYDERKGQNNVWSMERFFLAIVGSGSYQYQ